MIRFRSVTSPAAAALLLIHVPASGEVQMSPLTTFAGDGWLAPLEVSWLSDTGATERSIAYSASNDTLYVASRNGGPHIRMLDGTAGTELNAASEGVAMTGVSGGTFPINCVAATPDGVLYASNLVSPVTAASGFKIYRWDDVGSGPVTVFNSNTITAGRMGDTLDAFGSGASTLLVAGESNSTGTGARNGYAIFAPPAAGTDFTGTLVTFSGANPAAGDFRTGITFLDADSVIGSQGGGGFKFTSFAGSTGTFDQAKLLTNTSERPMDYIVLGGIPLLATLECNGNTTAPPTTYSTVRIYDLTVFNTPVLVASGRIATSYNTQGTSGPGTGSVQWGKVTGNSATLYALSTNNGIQAFTVTAAPPEPALEFKTLQFNGSQLTATWASAAGRTYRFEASKDLSVWTPVATALPAGAGGTTTYVWNIPAGFSDRAQVRVVRE